MPYLLLSGFLLFAAYPLIGTTMAVWVLTASQLALFVGEARKRQVSGVGAFIFMSFLFFGVRPIYLILENDYKLLVFLFHVRASIFEIGDAALWGSVALLCFALGAYFAPRVNRRWLQRRRANAHMKSSQVLVSAQMGHGMLCCQLVTLPLMYILVKSGRGLYTSSFGAYAYDLPVPLQSIHIVAVLVLLERYVRIKSPGSLVVLGVSVLLFLDFTWLMRDVSMFRGFYVAGVMIVGIAVLQRLKGRVGYAWIVIPIVAVQPFFQYLGEARVASNKQLQDEQLLDAVFEKRTLAETYWKFYDSKGDMNIFDTFVAAKQAQPAFYPYAWSWIYVPLHFIPRAWWDSKPKKGTTMDLSFTRGAPYCPGIAGFFLADGGLLWMLVSMALLGYLVSLLDAYVFTMPMSYLKYCLIGIVTVNAMFLSRAFLWFYFWQLIYAAVPCVLLGWFFGRQAQRARRRVLGQQRPSMRAAAPLSTE